MAVNTSGNIVTAYYFQCSTGLQAFCVEVCTSPDGVTWSGPTQVGQGVAPAVAIAHDGRAVVSWEGGPATSPNVQASVRPPGGTWGAPVTVDASGTTFGHPVLGMDNSGNTIAVWSMVTPSGPVMTASLPAGGNWTAPEQLFTFSAGPAVATTSVGGALVSWRTGNVFHVASGTILGGLGAPIQIGATYGHGIHPAPPSLNTAGDAQLMWFGNPGVFIATRTPDGTWSGTTRLSTNGYIVGDAIDAAGNGIAVFAVTETSGTATYVSLRPAGGAWGTPTLISALNDEGGAGVGADPAGTFVVAWTNNAGNVEAITIPPGGSVGPGVVVGSGPFDSLQVVPGLAVLSIGAGVAKEPIN
jgi:hypothetical protein